MKERLKKIGIGIVAGIAGTLLVWLLLNVGIFKEFFYRFEAVTYDWRVRKIITPPKYQIDEIIIVDIDGRTLNQMGSFYQWSRTDWAKMLGILKEGGVKLAAMDILFDKSKRFPKEDRAFVDAVADFKEVINAIVFTPADEDNFLYPMPQEPEGFPVERFHIDIPDQLAYRIRAFERVEPNFTDLLGAGAGIGAVNMSSDSDGILRRIPLFVRFNENVYPTFATAMMMRLLNITSVSLSGDQSEVIFSNSGGEAVRVPIDKDGRTLIYYHGPFQTFRYISLYSLLYEIEQMKEKSNILEYFQDKIVIVGASAPGLFDLRATPRQPSFPGVEVHANLLYQFLHKNFIGEMPGGEQFLLILLIGSLAGAGFAMLRPFGGVIYSLLLAVGLSISAWIAFSAASLWQPMIGPLLTILLTFTIHYTYRYMVEERDKREIRSIFSRYVSSSVVDELLKKPDMVKLGGEKRVCTVMFSDLANFTSLSETTEPEQLVRLLNEYLTEMTHIILSNQGTLDKYEADAIMAIFGAPIDLEQHALLSCKTALEMQKAIPKIRELWAKHDLSDLQQRIGINSGPMVIGNMGSDIRFDYTAIGDAVNLASRLEGANKLYGTHILISEGTFDLVRESVVARQLDLVRLKGKREPVKIFELIAMKDDPLDVKTREVLNYFQQGYQQYLARNWDWAINQFRQALQIKGNDGPSRLYLYRCQEFLEHPPADEWDGVYQLKTK